MMTHHVCLLVLRSGDREVGPAPSLCLLAQQLQEGEGWGSRSASRTRGFLLGRTVDR